MAKRVTFVKDYDGSDTGGRKYKKDEVADLADFQAGMVVGTGFATFNAGDSSDPASPKNLAGVDGHPVDPGGDPGDPVYKGAAGTLPGDDFIAGVKVDDKAENAAKDADAERKGAAKGDKTKG